MFIEIIFTFLVFKSTDNDIKNNGFHVWSVKSVVVNDESF